MSKTFCFIFYLAAFSTETNCFRASFLKLSCDSRFQRAFTACSCVLKVITLVWANQRNNFEIACVKRSSQRSLRYTNSFSLDKVCKSYFTFFLLFFLSLSLTFFLLFCSHTLFLYITLSISLFPLSFLSLSPSLPPLSLSFFFPSIAKA